MEFISDYISVTLFWRMMLFLHFVMAVSLLAVVTVQAIVTFMPARALAGSGTSVLRLASSVSYTKAVALLYVPTFLLGAWTYIKYRTYVRIPMEQLGHWWTLGSFEFKEHVVAMGMALLPAYWYFWQQPLSDQYGGARKAVTAFLAFTVWYAFIIGHVANDFRGVGS